MVVVLLVIPNYPVIRVIVTVCRWWLFVLKVVQVEIYPAVFFITCGVEPGRELALLAAFVCLELQVLLLGLVP